MRRRCIAFGLLALLTCMPLRAGDRPKLIKNDNVIAVESKLAVERVLPTLDLILEHHVAPPTRQEMTLEAARAAYREAQVPVTAQLATRVSTLSTHDDFQDFLESVARDVLHRSDLDKSAVAKTLIKGALKTSRGKPGFVATKAALVEEQMKGNRYVGVGIALQSHDESKLTQVNMLLDGPGAKAGLLKGDLLIACDGQSLSGKSLEQVVDLLRGPEGTELILEVQSPGDPATVERRTLKIRRSIVPIKTIRGISDEEEIATRHRVDPTAPVAYVRLTRIGGSVAQELEQLEPQLAAAGFEALILDLRSVSSDDLHHAVLLSDALLDEGGMGKVQTASGLKEFAADRDCLFREWPMAVLVDGTTAGTAEWVAAALQDRERATIIGFRTAGEPLVRSFVPIPGSDQSLHVATGILERDSDAELARLKRRRSRGHRPSELRSPAEVYFEEEPAHDSWRVIPDQVPEGLQELYMLSRSPSRFLPRLRRSAEPPPSGEVAATAPSPQAEPLAKDSPEDDHFIRDALRTLQGQLRERRAALTN